MNFTEEQLAFRESVRRMAEKHVAPIAAEVDETDRFPTELVKRFGEMGLMQLWIPERYGGPEGNLTMMCIAREEISRFSPSCGSIAGHGGAIFCTLHRTGGGPMLGQVAPHRFTQQAAFFFAGQGGGVGPRCVHALEHPRQPKAQQAGAEKRTCANGAQAGS